MEIHFSHAGVWPLLSMVNPIAWFAVLILTCVGTVPDMPILNSEVLSMSTPLLSSGGMMDGTLVYWTVVVDSARLLPAAFASVVCLSVRHVACACDALCRLRWVCLWHCPCWALPAPGTLSVLCFGILANDDDYWNAGGNSCCCWQASYVWDAGLLLWCSHYVGHRSCVFVSLHEVEVASGSCTGSRVVCLWLPRSPRGSCSNSVPVCPQ